MTGLPSPEAGCRDPHTIGARGPRGVADLVRQLYEDRDNPLQGRGARSWGKHSRNNAAVLIVEDDADLRRLTAALFEDEKVDTIERESAEAALVVMLIGGRE